MGRSRGLIVATSALADCGGLDKDGDENSDIEKRIVTTRLGSGGPGRQPSPLR